MLRAVQHTLRRFRNVPASKRAKPNSKVLFKEALAVTKEVSEQSTKKYYDPSNVTLDFSLLNRELVSKIIDASNDRVQKRLKEADQEWNQKVEKVSLGDMSDIPRRIRKLIVEARVSLNKNLSPLDVGDLVLLDSQSTVLHLVVDKPHDLKTSTFTLVNHEGEIMYAHRDQIKLRIPEVVSRRWLRPLKLVQLEKKHPGLAPIGMPDSKFSRSAVALPEGSKPSSRSPEAVSKESDSDVLTTGDDFIIAQAASQLLTDTDVKTYIVPSLARLLISKPLVDTSIASFRKLNQFTRVFDYIHKILQYDENNNLIASARTIPIFELFEIVTKFEHRFKTLLHSDGQDEFKVLNSQTRYLGLDGPTILGKKFPDLTKDGFGDIDYPISSYIAFMVALSQNPRRWKVNYHHNSKVPLSVDILPISKSLDVADVLRFLKANGIARFTDFYINHYRKPGSHKLSLEFQQVVSVLKDYVAGNIVNDRMLESVVSNLVRSIDDAMERDGLRKAQKIPYSFEYSKSRAFEIISSLEEDHWTNPLRWSSSLNLPRVKISPEADKNAAYYDFIDNKFTSKADIEKALESEPTKPIQPEIHLPGFGDTLSGVKSSTFDDWVASDFHKTDPYESIRTDFPDVPIYCIDSASAHEIDDGISIENIKKAGQWRFTVHIADPTSFIKQTSSLSQIALGKGATVYLPEGPSLMMPQLISKVCGMDVAGKNKSFAIQFKIDHSSLERYEQSRHLYDAKQIMNDIILTARVRLFNIKDNAVCITYEKVNKILEDESNKEKIAKGETQEGTREWDLFTLSRVASILNEIRSKHLGALDFPNESVKTFVTHVPKKELKEPHFQKTETGFQIAIVNEDSEQIPIVSIEKDANQSNESKSQELVSNFMVTANHAASEFARKKNIPIILRTQELKLSNGVSAEIKEIMDKCRSKDGHKMTVQEMSDLGKFMTAANYEANSRGHESLGLSSYSHFTSPLRRYADMINHWMCGDYLVNKGEMKMDKNNLAYLANHLQICLFVNKQAEKASIRFWQGSFLRQYFEDLQKGAISDPIEFEFLLLSDAKRGDISCKLAYFNLIKTKIVANTKVKKLFDSGEYEVGMVVKPRFKVKKIDMIENELTVELED